MLIIKLDKFPQANEKIREEHKELLKLIEELKAILASELKILDIIKKELIELKENYADERRTEIQQLENVEIDVEDIIKEEDMVITITHSGYIKRMPIRTYKIQRRGGKGVIGATTREEDLIKVAAQMRNPLQHVASIPE